MLSRSSVEIFKKRINGHEKLTELIDYKKLYFISIRANAQAHTVHESLGRTMEF